MISTCTPHMGGLSARLIYARFSLTAILNFIKSVEKITICLYCIVKYMFV